jgi:hypothetical protein
MKATDWPESSRTGTVVAPRADPRGERSSDCRGYDEDYPKGCDALECSEHGGE